MRLPLPGPRASWLVLALLSCSPPPQDDGKASANSPAGLTSPQPQLLASATLAPSDGLAFATITVTPRDSNGAPLGAGLHVEVLSSDALVTLGGTGTSACTVPEEESKNSLRYLTVPTIRLTPFSRGYPAEPTHHGDDEVALQTHPILAVAGVTLLFIKSGRYTPAH